MTCYKPLTAYRSKIINPESGKRSMVFDVREALDDREQLLPCGQCIGCRLDYSVSWATRCVHEAHMNSVESGGQGNCFITLTYNDESLPANGSLDYRHWTLFLMRLRKRYGSGIRFFMGPEYGDLSRRPHYHALLFGFDFSDKEIFTQRGEFTLYTSKELDSLWTDPKSGASYGFASVGSVSFESAAYVARYMLKKIKGDDPLLRYFTEVDQSTGEIIPIEPEKARMSRMPGLGSSFLEKYHTDIYPSDQVVLSGKGSSRVVTPPKFYDNFLKNLDPYAYDFIKESRVNNALLRDKHSTRARLDTRCYIKERKLSDHLSRPL